MANLTQTNLDVQNFSTLREVLNYLKAEHSIDDSGLWFDHIHAPESSIELKRSPDLVLLTDGRVSQTNGGNTWVVDGATVCVVVDKAQHTVAAAHFDIFELADRAEFSILATNSPDENPWRRVYFNGDVPPQEPSNY